MNKTQQPIDNSITKGIPDDVLTLTREYSLTQLNYINLLQKERLADMMKRWNLIAELAQLKQTHT